MSRRHAPYNDTQNGDCKLACNCKIWSNSAFVSNSTSGFAAGRYGKWEKDLCNHSLTRAIVISLSGDQARLEMCWTCLGGCRSQSLWSCQSTSATFSKRWSNPSWQSPPLDIFDWRLRTHDSLISWRFCAFTSKVSAYVSCLQQKYPGFGPLVKTQTPEAKFRGTFKLGAGWKPGSILGNRKMYIHGSRLQHQYCVPLLVRFGRPIVHFPGTLGNDTANDAANT